MVKKHFKAIVTVGPSSLNKIKRINKIGPCIFRINGAYVPVNKIKGLRDMIKESAPDAPILVDFPSDKKWFRAHDKKIKTKFLGTKDIAIIKKVCNLNIEYIGLSHVNTVVNINQVQKIIKDTATGSPELICKIETAQALINLNQILYEISNILIDRGDLSREIGMNELPYQQQLIIKEAKLHGCNVYLATNFLKSMQTDFTPSIPESLDLYKTIQSGIDGIQMSEETAIGTFPVRCVQYIFEQYKNCKRG